MNEDMTMNITRHKCFISYHKNDSREVDAFIQRFDVQHRLFIRRMISEMDNNIVNSSDKNYVMRRIREDFLSDSTVTIVLIGRCTWARRYVDWEIMSSLRDDPINKRSGLMAIQLPSVVGTTPRIPDRLLDNVATATSSNAYAKYYRYPASANELTEWIEDAFQARTSRASFVDNTRIKRQNNGSCI